MKPRIVLLSAFATPFRSGAEACVEEVSMRLKNTYDITIVTARLSSSLPIRGTISGVPVIRVGFGSSLDKWLFPLLSAFAVIRLKPDIIHAVLESYAGLALVLCRFLYPKAKRILTLQSTNTSMLLGSMHRAADHITAISSVLVRRAEKYGRHNVKLIPNGISLDVISKAYRMYPKVSQRLLFVGRLEPMKGVDTLLRAFAALPDDLRSKAELHVVGNGSLRASLINLAKQLRIQSQVSFRGFIAPPDVYKEFAEAQVFCGLSRSEALGNVFLEAQAAGCAVVATDVGGIPDIVLHQKTGILVEPDDPEGAAEAIEDMLVDTAKRHELVQAGLHHAASYDWLPIAHQYAALYEILLPARTNSAALNSDSNVPASTQSSRKIVIRKPRSRI